MNRISVGKQPILAFGCATSERLIPSRDRKGADSYLASKLFCNEQGHGIFPAGSARGWRTI